MKLADFRVITLSGVRQFRDHPQLWLTIVVAIAIVGSFVYIANRFATIAQDAQEQLVHARAGALQDGFAPFASRVVNQPDLLRHDLAQIMELNPTVVDFYYVEKRPEGWTIIASADGTKEGTQLIGYDFLLNLAGTDAAHSFTAEEVRGGVRFFKAVRAVTNDEGSSMGVLVAQQTLSRADQVITESLTNSIIILVLVLLFLLLLFFRHARIIDYTVLYHNLRELDQLKDDFISMASHELRAPLTAIRGYAELVRDVVIDEKAKVLTERIDQSAQQLNQLVADMLDVSRIQQGRLTLEPKVINPNAILSTVCDAFQSVAEKKSLNLSRVFEAEAEVLVDPDRLQQVITNLVSNAIKYTETGQIIVKTSQSDGRFIIRVSDTGIGMSAEEQKKLFQKFYRASGGAVRAQVGTGLGLWITKRLIEELGGQISVESIQGVGSHFVVAFPIVHQV